MIVLWKAASVQPGWFQAGHRTTDRSTFTHPTDGTQASQNPPGGASGGPIALQPPAKEKDISGPLDVLTGARRWYVLGYSDRHSHEQYMIYKEFTMIFSDQSRKSTTLSALVPQKIMSMYYKSRRTRSNDLVCKTIRSRTARSDNPSRVPRREGSIRNLLI